MEVDLQEFKGKNVKVVATIDQTLYRNVGAIILYEEDSHILSVRKLKRKIADQFSNRYCIKEAAVLVVFFL